MANIKTNRTSGELFTDNLTSSQLILVGEIVAAEQLLSTFTIDELISSKQSIEAITKHKNYKQMSYMQRACLKQKHSIIEDIIATR